MVNFDRRVTIELQQVRTSEPWHSTQDCGSRWHVRQIRSHPPPVDKRDYTPGTIDVHRHAAQVADIARAAKSRQEHKGLFGNLGTGNLELFDEPEL